MKRKILSALLVMTMSVGLLSGCGSNDEKPANTDSAQIESSDDTKKLVFWDKAEYVDGYAVIMKQTVERFGEENNVEIDYVNVAAADMKQKLMASIEAGNPPDLIVGDDILVGRFASLDQLEDVSDIMSEFDFMDSAKTFSIVGDSSYIVPQSFMAPGVYVRKDIWDKNGLKMPTTWEELRDQARIVNDPANGFYALAYAMGASGGGDAESFVRTIMLDWGGSTVDSDGNILVNSPENIAAFEFIKSLYDEGLISPDAITGDDSWNNQAYLSGTAGIITNSGSVVTKMREENPELLANTQIIPYPAGPNGDAYALCGCNVFGVIKSGKNTDVAKDFIRYYFSDKENYESMIQVMNSMWQPVLNGMEDTEFWLDEGNRPWLENSKIGVQNAYPAKIDDKSMTGFSNQLCVKAVQDMLVNGATPEEAIASLEQEFIKLYK